MVLDCVPSARGKGGSGEVGVDEEVVSSEGMSREQAQRPYPRTELGGGGVGSLGAVYPGGGDRRSLPGMALVPHSEPSRWREG